MENEVLKAILDTYKNKSNKDLSNTLMTLHHDFNQVKDHMVQLTALITEIGDVYDKVYVELQSRLKFEDKKEEDVNRD